MYARKWPRCFQSRPRLRLGKLSPTKRSRIWGRDQSDGTSATDDLIVRQPFEPVRKTGGLFCRFENSPIDAEQAWSFLGSRSEALTKAFLLTLATRTFLEPEKFRSRVVWSTTNLKLGRRQ